MMDNINQTLIIAKAYPNPTQHRIFLDIDHYTEGVAQFEILDVTGRVVHSSFQTLEKGTHTVTLDVNQLAKGLYIVRINDSSHHTAVVKFSRL